MQLALALLVLTSPQGSNASTPPQPTLVNLGYDAQSYQASREVVAILADLGLVPQKSLVVFDPRSRTTTELGLLVAGVFEVQGPWVVVGVLEFAQGVDLNGDGDLADSVVHAYDARTGDTWNTGLANVFFQVDGDRLAVIVPEQGQGQLDLNGDGDADDRVAFVLGLPTREVDNLGYSVTTMIVRDSYTILFVREDGVDLNGNGSGNELKVLHVVDPLGAVTNVGLEVSFDEVDLQRNALLFRVDEARQGVDLNGDGDTRDDVVHVMDVVSTEVRNLGLASSTNNFDVELQNDGSIYAVSVDEAMQGATDLNGDGDTLDDVLHTGAVRGGAPLNLGLDPSILTVVGGRVAFAVDEASQGADFNGDADALDHVLHVYSVANASLSNLGLAIAEVLAYEDILALRVIEADQGQTDLTGDGDANDVALHLHEFATGVTTNLARGSLHMPLVAPQLDRNRRVLAYTISEYADTTDHNGDGDAFDSVTEIMDLRSKAVTGIPLATSDVVLLTPSLMVLQVPEASQAETDLNGDGDTLDLVPHVALLDGPLAARSGAAPRNAAPR